MPRELWLPFALFIILIGFFLRQGALVAIGSVLLLIESVAWLWNKLSLVGVEYERAFTERRAFIGETVELTLRVVNKKSLPLPWVEVVDRFPPGLAFVGQVRKLAPSTLSGKGSLTRSTSLWGYQRVYWRYQLHCQTRGYFVIGPARLRSGDVFGLLITERAESHIDSLIVYPRILPIERLGLPSKRPFGDIRGGESIFEDPVRILGLRDYRYNDPLRRIDWKATARRQALQVKVFEPTITLHFIIFLNIDTLGYSWQGHDPVLLERAIATAASVASYAYHERCAVGLLANSTFPLSDQPIKIPPSRAPDQLTRILEALAVIVPFTTSNIESLLERELHSLPLGATVVVITAIFNESLLAPLMRLREGGHRVVLLSVSEKGLDRKMEGITVYNVGEFLGHGRQD